jgi:hypothetical protein
VRPRELLAAAVIVVGGLLWLVVPDMKGGSLRDKSEIARLRMKPNGTALIAWFLVENRGPRTITLTGARIANELPEGAEVLGTRARIGEVATYDDVFPGPTGPFLRLEGFRIPPNRGATIGFGLQLPPEGEVRLDDARLTYRESGDDHELRAAHTARICILVTKDAC